MWYVQRARCASLYRKVAGRLAVRGKSVAWQCRRVRVRARSKGSACAAGSARKSRQRVRKAWRVSRARAARSRHYG